ncbi:HTH-like domain-containing protein [Brevibacterium sp. 239c]|nr:HTH-like domain-containing protein [Brevibacterium sp. 239c]
MVIIQDIYEANYSCYGARKMWKAINREHTGRFGPVARCTSKRLMHRLGIDGVRTRRKQPTTAPARAEECPDDLVMKSTKPSAAPFSPDPPALSKTTSCGGDSAVLPGET